jgi:hypothetical protein
MSERGAGNPFSKFLERRLVFGIALFALCAVQAFRLRAYVVDDGYIFLRFAWNLRHGFGWSFNSGHPINAATSPLWTMVLACVEPYCARSPAVFVATYAVFVWVAAATTAELARPMGGLLMAGVGIIAALDPILWQSIGLETPLFMALVALSVLAHQRERRATEGVLLGLAVLARPDAGLLAVMLWASALLKRRRVPWASMIGAACVYAPWLVLSIVMFGSPFPTTLGAKLVQSHLSWWATETPFAVAALRATAWGIWGAVAALLALSGYQAKPAEFPLRILIGYGVLHALAYSAMRAPVGYWWYYAPLSMAVGVGAVVGAHRVSRIVREGIKQRRTIPWSLVLGAQASLVALFVFFEGSMDLELPSEYRHSGEYHEAATWIAEHSSVHTTVAATEIGYIGYYADRDIVDMHGLIHPEAREAIKSGDAGWWRKRLPGIIIKHRKAWFAEPHFDQKQEELDAWFDDRYQLVATFGDGEMGVEIWSLRTP